MLNALFGLSFGGILAGTYLIAKLTGANGGMDVACVSALIVFFIHLAIWPKLILNAFKDWRNILRGFLFGVAQIFLFKAQSEAPTSTMLIASIAGAIAGGWFGKLILKEHPSWNEILAMVVAVGGTILGANGHIESNIWAVAGGLIQGLTGIAARSLMKSKVSRRGAVGSGFFILGIVTLLWLVIMGKTSTLTTISIWGVVGVGIAGICSQYAFFHLYKIYNTQKAAIFTLLRAPWGVLLEAVLLSNGVVFIKAISSVIVFLAAVIALYKPKNTTRHSG